MDSFSTNNYENIDDNQKLISEKLYKDNALKIGSKVFHQKFGYGNVINLEDDVAEVKFDKTNIKKVKVTFLLTDV